jgi:hypothetical protein
MLSSEGEGVNSAGWCAVVRLVKLRHYRLVSSSRISPLTVGRAAINRWVSGNMRQRAFIRTLEIDFVFFSMTSGPRRKSVPIRHRLGLWFALHRSDRGKKHSQRGDIVTTNATILHTDSILAEGRVGRELQPERADLRRHIERLFREIFEGHEEFLGVTPD